MILYDYVLSASCYKVRLMASLIRAELALEAVNFHPAQDHKSPEMLALNPAGTLPVLRDGDLVLSDSADILTHLVADAPEWLAREGRKWIDFASDLNASLGMARLHDILNYEADIDQARSIGVKQLRALEAHLTERRFEGKIFLTADTPTIEDIACFPNVALAPDGGVSLDMYPSIRLWMRAIRSLSGFVEMPGIHRLHELDVL